MTPEEPTSSKSQIRQFLFVVGSGALFGFLIVLTLLYFYSPTGQYRVKQVLLSPQTLEHLSYGDTNPKTGGTSRFLLDKIEYTYFDTDAMKWENVDVSSSEFGEFFDQVQNDLSLLPVTEEVLSLFKTTSLSTLTIEVKTESPAKWQSVKETFQKVQFASDGNHYRIELHEDDPGTNWAYFYHLGIEKKFQGFIK